MSIPVAIRRQAYRVAHRLLRVWWFVRRPPLHGVKCILTDSDRVLLVRHTYGDRSWDLPGGTVRRSEDAAEAATREMEEELGVHVERWHALGDVLRFSYGHKDTLHCFHAEVDAPALSLNRAELAEAQWFAASDLPTGTGRHVDAIVERARTYRPTSLGVSSGAAGAAAERQHSPGRPSDNG
jgi:8-oxo-dGTP pyrophosphatase MutT (NUDIX family)